jgi:hypothetical protein
MGRAFRCAIVVLALAAANPILPASAQNTGRPDPATCAPRISAASAVARGISVTIAAATPQQAGIPLQVSWAKNSAARSQLPLYIVVTAPPEVRFAGTAFMALTAAADGPYKMQYGKDQSRALIALYRKTDTASRGEFAITPYRSGTQTYGWAVVTAGSCGEQILAQGGRTVEVAPGAAELVVQDRFSTDQPKQHIFSNDGTYDLRVFDNRFEVHDVATDSLIFSATGTEPNFSPTGRFVAWADAGSFSIADLISRTIIAKDFDSGFLVWARSDSYVIAGAGGGGTSGFGSVQVKNSLVDESNVLSAWTGPHTADSWNSARVTLDLDRGFVLATGEQSWKIGDLFATTQSKELDTSAIDNEDRPDALTRIRETYDPGYAKLPTIWSLGERLKLSHADSFQKTQLQFLVRHRSQATANMFASGSAPAGLLVGRGIVGGRGIGDKPLDTPIRTDQAFRSLARFDVHTEAPIPLQHIYNADEYLAAERTAIEREKTLTDAEVLAQAEQEAKSRNERLDEIRSRLPQARTLFTNENYRSVDCQLDPSGNTQFQISPDWISNIWQWQTPNGGRWIVQTATGLAGSSGQQPHDCLILLRENSRDGVISLTSKLGIGGDQITVHRLSPSTIAVAFSGDDQHGGIGLFDAEAGAPVGQVMPLLRGSLLSELRLTADGKNLVQLNRDGEFFINRNADGKRLLQGTYVDGETVLMTDDGRYDTSYEGAASVQVRFAGMPGLFTVNQFESLLRRQNLAKDVLAGRDPAPRPATLAAPPTARLILAANPDAGRRTGKVIAASTRGLSAVHIYTDGRLIAETPAQGQQAEVPVDVPDPGGAHWITAIAVDADGLVSLPSQVQIPGAPQPRGIARVVAVGDDVYADPEIPTLESTKLDARHFVQALQSTQGHAFTSVRPTLLLDADVTPESVLNAVKAAVSETGPDDTLVFFFAGHGVDGARLDQPDAGLVLTTNRTRLNNLAATSVRWTTLANLFGASKGTVIVVLDACQSGIAGRDALTTNDDVVSALFTKSGAPLIVLAASKGRQASQEAANGGGGYFTNAIVAAMTERRAKFDRNHSGLLGLDELYAGVKARVEAETDGKQTPWLARNRLVGEISLF